MKFTNGYWQMRPGLTAHFAQQVYDVEVGGDALTVYAPTGRVVSRGDTLDGPVMTVRYSSPMDNVICVEAQHFKGGRKRDPAFEILAEGAPRVSPADGNVTATLTSGALTVRIAKGDAWGFDFVAQEADGERVLTSSGWRGLGGLLLVLALN